MAEKISFICPALNEEELVEQTVREFMEKIDGLFEAYEILLFNDGSTDKTPEIMDRLENEFPEIIKVTHNPINRNIGYCFKEGIKKASYPYVQLICSDSTFDRGSYINISQALGKTDIVVPYVVNLKEEKTPFRYKLSCVYRVLMNFLFGLKLKYHNGLSVFKSDQIRSISIRSDGFFFQVECLVKLLKKGSTYQEVSCSTFPFFRIEARALSMGNVVDMAKAVTMLFVDVRLRDR